MQCISVYQILEKRGKVTLIKTEAKTEAEAGGGDCRSFAHHPMLPESAKPGLQDWGLHAGMDGTLPFPSKIKKRANGLKPAAFSQLGKLKNEKVTFRREGKVTMRI